MYLKLVFVTLTVVGVLGVSCSGYFEVGMSSYLKDAIEYSPDSGWQLLRPWHATGGRKGLFDSHASGQQAFSDRFITFEPGIYYVAANLRIANVYCGFIHASVVVNSQFNEKNGLSGVFGNTTSTETLVFSGLLHLFENDVFAVYLHGSAGKVLPDSTFSAVLLTRMGSVPGFQAVLSRDQEVQFDKWTSVENWKTSGAKGLFEMHTGVSPSVGQFCAILGGVYLFTSNSNIKSSQHTTVCTTGIVLDSGITLIERLSSGTEEFTAGLSGIFYLQRGSCVQFRIKPVSMGSVTVRSGSGFSGIFLGSDRSNVPQLSAFLPPANIQRSGWNLLGNWSTNSSKGNFQSEQAVWTQDSSTFRSSESRLFIVTATVNINVSKPVGIDPVYLLISVNGAPSDATGNNGFLSGKQSLMSSRSLLVSGAVLLNEGDTLTVYIYHGGSNLFSVVGHFGVSVVSFDWPGVGASLKDDIPLASSDWTALTSWVTYNKPGLFSFDNAFLPASGKYIANVDGVYFVSCNARFKGAGSGALSVLIAVDDILDPTRGLYSYHGNPKSNVTLSVVGSIMINRGQNVSVFARTTEISSWTILAGTGFSMVLIGAESITATGFLARVQESSSFTSPSWKRLGRWMSSEADVRPFFQTGSLFNSTSGQFEAMVDGLYLVSANILISHSGSALFEMKILQGGDTTVNSAVQYLLQKPSPLPPVDIVNTLTLSGAVRLIRGQNISIFIQPQSNVSWMILPNSSFSVVLVSRLESAFCAGFLAYKFVRTSHGHSLSVPSYWRDERHIGDGYNNPFHVNLKIDTYVRATVADSGLYFVQGVLYVKFSTSAVDVFHIGVCINGQYYEHAVTASKLSEGSASELFSIGTFGVLYLRTRDVITLCSRSDSRYHVELGGGFSLLRFLPFKGLPGLYQSTPDSLQAVTSLNPHSEWYVITSWSTGGDILSYIHNNVFDPSPTLPSDQGVFMAPLDGSYLISLTLDLQANTLQNVWICVGPENCSTCNIRFSATLDRSNMSVSFTHLVDLGKDEAVSVCINFTGSSFPLISGKRSFQFLDKVNATTTLHRKHDPVVFTSRGWQRLLGWRNSKGEPSGNFSISVDGLYILSATLPIRSIVEGIVGFQFEVTGAVSARQILSVLTSSEANVLLTLSVAVLARLSTAEVLNVSVYSDSPSWSIPQVSTFFVARVPEATQCFSVRSRGSLHRSGKWWTPVLSWSKVDLQCVSPNSNDSNGRFVAGVGGVYFTAVVVVIKTYGSSLKNRTVEILLSVNGDVNENNSLKTVRTMKGGSQAVLSLSSTVYLEQWQTLYIMIRSTGLGTVEVVNGSTFSVVLTDEKPFYKRVATNVSQFDEGPRIIRHPPPAVRLGGDLGSNVSWTCEAVARNLVTYKWFRDDKHVASLSKELILSNAVSSDSGRYVCLAESNGITVSSSAAELQVFDTTPKFETFARNLAVPEGGTVSMELRYTAVDQEGHSTNVSVNFIDGNTNDTFEIAPETSTRQSILRNIKPLNYEQINLYSLKIVGTNVETKKSATVNVTIAVMDTNDNLPTFSKSNYMVSVPENATFGTVVFQANATDNDSSNHSIISYSFLSGQADGPFVIGSSSGNVTLNGSLDSETTNDVTLCIQATDGKYVANTKLYIAITDVNEFPPVFSPQNYTRRISETAVVGELVAQVFAIDQDSGNNGQISYNITNGNVDDTFSIDVNNGSILLQKSLDFETHVTYELVVMATDGQHSSLNPARVVIQVVDANDNNPTFEQSLYWFSILENATLASLVGTVKARDDDSNENSIVTHSIPSVGDYKKFQINSSTGEISTAANLDFEKARDYIIMVEARDSGDSPRMAAVLVNISAVDVNDQSPECEPCFYSASISEGSSLGTPVVRVIFKDRDSARHSQISYSISDGNTNNTFNITSNGEVILQRALDRESLAMYNLTIYAVNSGANALTSPHLAVVNITVIDINDNYPSFSSQWYSVNVSEDVAIGSSIVAVKALDIDSGLNGYVTYSLADTPCNNAINITFSVNSTSGVIFTLKHLKWSLFLSEYVFQVKAHDHGLPSLVSYANVRVTIVDVNDSPPKFTKDIYLKEFENPPDSGTVLIRVTFTDADHAINGRHILLIQTVNTSADTCGNDFTITWDGNISNASPLQYQCTYSMDVIVADSAGSDLCVVRISVGQSPADSTVSEKETGFISKGGEVSLLVLLFILIVALILIVIWLVLHQRRQKRYIVGNDGSVRSMEMK